MSKTHTDHRSDTDLLLAYGRDGDEAAFEALAARHVDMIFAVSLRRSGNRQLAEEATQNVLVSLASKARKLSAQESSLTGWLHTATKFEVSKLQRREARIKMREQDYATDQMKTSTQAQEETFWHLLPILDQAIDQLRSPDREVIVRRYLEGQDFRRIGDALGISEDAAQKRTSRAFDALNRFFKRKAGVTVSATALAAGISQHCAEAAPAVCLQIAGKTAATGMASILTTTAITTMSVGKIAAIAAGVAVIGGGIALLNTGEKRPPETVYSSPASSSATGTQSAPNPSGKIVARRTASNAAPAANANSYSPNEELARLEARTPHPGPDEMARRLSVKHGQWLTDLTADLGLNADEVAGVKTVLDTRLKKFRASLDHEAAPDDLSEQRKEEKVPTAGSLIRGAGLREDLAGVLSEDQLTAFDEREERIQQSQVESFAYRELAKITPVLKLTEAQKDIAFELLQTSAAEKLQQDGDGRAFMALQSNQAPAQLDLTDAAEEALLFQVFDGPNAPPRDSPEFKKQLTEVVGGLIRKQVELLSPALDQRQKQRYHEFLVSKSLLSLYEIPLSAPVQK